jgi:hypothetical protein
LSNGCYQLQQKDSKSFEWHLDATISFQCVRLVYDTLQHIYTPHIVTNNFLSEILLLFFETRVQLLMQVLLLKSIDIFISF